MNSDNTHSSFPTIPPLPPKPALFPYTTLFRSYRRVTLPRELPLAVIAPQVQVLTKQARDILDRKSTRLNSSHVAISYAVFCLKKKHQSEHVRRIPDGDEGQRYHSIMFQVKVLT